MHLDSGWLIAGLTVISVLLLPTLVLMVRGVVKWTRTEDRLSELVTDVKTLVDDQDKVHTAMLEQMRTDREATDRRLRFIEEWFMQRGRDALS
jgi:hypothetical protein